MVLNFTFFVSSDPYTKIKIKCVNIINTFLYYSRTSRSDFNNNKTINILVYTAKIREHQTVNENRRDTSLPLQTGHSMYKITDI